MNRRRAPSTDTATAADSSTPAKQLHRHLRVVIITVVVQQQLSTRYDVAEFNGLRGGNRLRPEEVLSPTAVAVADDISYGTQAAYRYDRTAYDVVSTDTLLDTRERVKTHYIISFPISIIHVNITEMTRQI